VTQGQGNQSRVAFYVRVEFQLFAPPTAIPHQSAAGSGVALLGIVQNIVKLGAASPESPQVVDLIGGGGATRTPDLGIMRPSL
jgi:hypothetical protein